MKRWKEVSRLQDARAADQHQAVGWLVVFAEVQGFRWVVQHSRMAFSEGMASRARRMGAGDQLILYLARGAFHNPTRDRSHLAGLATVMSPMERLPEILRIGNREFAWGCDLDLAVVLPERQGVPIHSLLSQLSFVQDKQRWGVSFRPGLIRLADPDLQLLTTAIRNATIPQTED
jgi:hypothetical protein